MLRRQPPRQATPAANPQDSVASALQCGLSPSDETGMNLSSLALVIVAGMALTLYIMRRRSRTGKRTPKF